MNKQKKNLKKTKNLEIKQKIADLNSKIILNLKKCDDRFVQKKYALKSTESAMRIKNGQIHEISIYHPTNPTRPIPEIIRELSLLKKFSINNTEYNMIPEFIGELETLESLTIINNHNIQNLPQSLSRLKNLKELIVFQNENLSNISDIFSDYQNLMSLDLSFNNLKQIPHSFGNLINLKNLDLSNNNLKQLPDFLVNLVNLKSLNVGGNKNCFVSKNLETNWLDKIKDVKGIDDLIYEDEIDSYDTLDKYSNNNNNPREIDYNTLKQLISFQIRKSIKENDGAYLLKMFETIPSEFWFELKNVLLEKLRSVTVSMTFEEIFQNFQKDADNLHFTNIIHFLLKILCKFPNFINNQDKSNFYCLFNDYVNVITTNHLKILIEALKTQIIEVEGKQIFEKSRLIKALVYTYPDFGIMNFSTLITKELFDAAKKAFLDYPDVLQYSPDLIDSFLNNVEFNFEQIHIINEFLEENPHIWIKINQTRIKKKEEFLAQFQLLKEEKPTNDWIETNSYVIMNIIDLFSLEELKDIIEKSISLKIRISNDLKPYWLNLLLFSISKKKNKEIFEDYLMPLLDLNYRQIVRDFLIAYPEKISSFNTKQLIKLGNFLLDIIQRQSQYFENQVEKLFKILLEKQIYLIDLIRVFYTKFPNFQDNLTNLLIERIKFMDFTQSTIEIYHYFTVLIEDSWICENHPKFPAHLIETKSIKYLQKKRPEFRSFFMGKQLWENFHHFEPDTKEYIMKFIENDLNSFGFFAKYNSKAFNDYIDSFLEKDIEERFQNTFYSILITYLRRTEKNSKLFQTIYQKIKDFKDSYIKAIVYLLLGKSNETIKIFDSFLRSKLEFKDYIKIYLDYFSLKIEINYSFMNSTQIIRQIGELSDIQKDLRQISINDPSNIGFQIRLQYLFGRLYFLRGLREFEKHNTEQTQIYFQEAIEQFTLSSESKLRKYIVLAINAHRFTTKRLKKELTNYNFQKDKEFTKLRRIIGTIQRDYNNNYYPKIVPVFNFSCTSNGIISFSTGIPPIFGDIGKKILAQLYEQTDNAEQLRVIWYENKQFEIISNVILEEQPKSFTLKMYWEQYSDLILNIKRLVTKMKIPVCSSSGIDPLEYNFDLNCEYKSSNPIELEFKNGGIFTLLLPYHTELTKPIDNNRIIQDIILLRGEIEKGFKNIKNLCEDDISSIFRLLLNQDPKYKGKVKFTGETISVTRKTDIYGINPSNENNFIGEAKKWRGKAKFHLEVQQALDQCPTHIKVCNLIYYITYKGENWNTKKQNILESIEKDYPGEKIKRNSKNILCNRLKRTGVLKSINENWFQQDYSYEMTINYILLPFKIRIFNKAEDL